MLKVTKGLRFRKVDLHIHTPASRCYTGTKRVPKDIIDAAKNARLDAISITDHNTGEWIDDIKKAANGSGITVFPGAEITSSEGIHIIALFDTNKGSVHIKDLLSELRIDSDKQGRSEALSEKNARQVMEIVAERGGLAVLAHIDEPKGILRVLSGQPCIKIFNEGAYVAVETSTGKLPKEINSGWGIKRKIVCYQASDNPNPLDRTKHSSEGIGDKYSYFKLSDTINLEGLRQCFTDSEVRICPMEEYEEVNFPKILNLRASAGFLKNQNIPFHPGLNSIIGGKGVGKSLIVEFLRFALSQPSTDKIINKDHLGKLEFQLGKGYNIEVEFELPDGTCYKVTRTYGGACKCTNLSTNEEFKGKVSSLFPILAYSQTEVINIAQDSESQLELIDGFINKEIYINKIKELNEDLSKNDSGYSACLRAHDKLDEKRKESSTIEEQINSLDREFGDDEANKLLMDQYRLSEKKINTVEGFESGIEGLIKLIKTTRANATKATEAYDNSIHDDVVDYCSKIMKDAKKLLVEQLMEAEESLKKYKLDVFNKKQELIPEFEELKGKCKEITDREEGKKAKRIQRDELAKRLTDVQRAEEELSSICTNLGEIEQERGVLMLALQEVKDEYYGVRKKMFDLLTAKSGGELQLGIIHGSNRVAFKDGLQVLLKGSGIQGNTINQMCEKITPSEFVKLILDRDENGLVQRTSIANSSAKKIIEKIWSYESLEDLLKLEHECYPEDTPEIKYRRAKGDYASLDKLSVGQKCTALLIIALSEGTRPVIIDQPEDALDITTVWNNISKRLRDCKTTRQFILTTHNPTVSVSSDSDLFIEVRGNAIQANVTALGGIEDYQVKEAVIDHLEGGDEAYHLRRRKYNINEN